MKTAIYGFGALGQTIARMMAGREDLRLAAVVDTAPALAGRTVASVLAATGPDLPIVGTLPPATEPSILFHAATSNPAIVEVQITEALEKGYSVISAAEWLFHPWLRFRPVAEKLEAMAKERGLFVLGCGINPGFAFETLPVLLARTVDAVSEIEILRVSNVRGIGPGDFAHIGFGLTPEAFSAAVAAGEIEGHMGFPESVASLAEYLGLQVDSIADQLIPAPAKAPIELAFGTVAAGEVAAIRQIATGSYAGRETIRMVLEMYLDPDSFGATPKEEVTVKGGRNFKVSIEPGAPSVGGAAAMLFHTARILSSAHRPSGLLSLIDLPAGAAAHPRSLRAASSARDGRGVSIVVE